MIATELEATMASAADLLALARTRIIENCQEIGALEKAATPKALAAGEWLCRAKKALAFGEFEQFLQKLHADGAKHPDTLRKYMRAWRFGLKSGKLPEMLELPLCDALELAGCELGRKRNRSRGNAQKDDLEGSSRHYNLLPRRKPAEMDGMFVLELEQEDFVAELLEVVDDPRFRHWLARGMLLRFKKDAE